MSVLKHLQSLVWNVYLFLQDQLRNPAKRWIGRWFVEEVWVKARNSGNLDSYMLINDLSHEIHFRKILLFSNEKKQIQCTILIIWSFSPWLSWSLISIYENVYINKL